MSIDGGKAESDHRTKRQMPHKCSNPTNLTHLGALIVRRRRHRLVLVHDVCHARILQLRLQVFDVKITQNGQYNPYK